MNKDERNRRTEKEYELFKRNLSSVISEYESELIKLIKSVSVTYSDVDRELSAIRQNAMFSNDKVLLEVLRGAERYFETKKGSLTLE